MAEIFEVVGDAFASKKIDEANSLIRDVKCLGRVSQNGYSYSDKAFEDAAKLYEGVSVYFDHLRRDSMGRPLERSRRFEDLAGRITNTRVDGEGVYGDLQIFEDDSPRVKKLFAAAKRSPEQFGLSHFAYAADPKDGNEEVVEGIERVFSVDIVTEPATNKSLFEDVSPRKRLSALAKEHEGAKLHDLIEQIAATDDMEVPILTQEPEAQMLEGLKAAVIAKIDMATEEQLRGVVRALDMKEPTGTVDDSVPAELTPAADVEPPAPVDTPEPEAPEEEAPEEAPDKKEAEDEEKKKREQLELELAAEKAKNMLLEARIKATPVRVEALVASSNQRELIESWAPHNVNGKPDASPPARLNDGPSERYEARWKAALSK